LHKLRHYTQLSDEAIFRCFAYSSSVSWTHNNNGNPSLEQEEPLRLPALPDPLPSLQYDEDDYVMIVNASLVSNNDNLLFSIVTRDQDDLRRFLRSGETSWMKLDEPVFLTTFPDPPEYDEEGDRLYPFPVTLLPLQVTVYLWRQDQKYVELFSLTDCIHEGKVFWSVNEDDSLRDIVAQVCVYEFTGTVRHAFPALSEEVVQRLSLSHDGQPATTPYRIHHCYSFLFDVYYARKHGEEAPPTEPRTANIHISEFNFDGHDHDMMCLEEMFNQEEDEEQVLFRHLLEVMSWKNIPEYD
jgi:hypothetical protein